MTEFNSRFKIYYTLKTKFEVVNNPMEVDILLHLQIYKWSCVTNNQTFPFNQKTKFIPQKNFEKSCPKNNFENYGMYK